MEHFLHSAQYILSFVFVISIIVFVHEFGHYYVAKLCGVKIETFSIGFGPEIWGWNDKSGTRWKIAVLPLGGYVKMFGDTNPASVPDSQKIAEFSQAEKKIAFHCKPLWQKAAVVIAGPASNFLFAIVVLSCFFIYYGKPHSVPEVGSVMPGSAAEQIGLKSGDIVEELDGQKIERFEDLRVIASMNPDTKMKITYSRGGKKINGSITPKLSESHDIFGNKVKVGLLGIASSKVEYEKIGFPRAIFEAFNETYQLSINTLKAIGQIITGKRDSSELSGILRIGKYSGQAAEQGASAVLWLMVVLSVNLGLVNLFPIPMLDGGHLLFYAIEAASGRPLAERFQQFGFKFGLAVLVALMLFATFNDLKYFNLF